MGTNKGAGQSSEAGVYAALASAGAANQAYQLGSQEAQWAQQQWQTEWPYIQQATTSDLASQQLQQTATKQLMDFSKNQQDFYEAQYQPMEASYNNMVSNWASPNQIATNAGQAMANVNESVNAQKTSSQQQLEGYGVDPSSTRFAGLDAAVAVQGGAASAGAGTQAIQNTKLQQLGMMAGAINTGRGAVNSVASLSGAGTGATSAGTGAGTGSTSGLTSGLTSGASAMTAGAAYYGAGAQNMGVYTGAVNGYNQSQAQFAQAGAAQSAGYGSLLGGLAGTAGSLYGSNQIAGAIAGLAAKGGPIEKFQDGGDVGGSLPIVRPAYLTAGPVLAPQGVPQGAIQGAPQQGAPQQGVLPPRGGTPGGFIPPHLSPSQGQVDDDVDAKLTAGEFIIPKDVVAWNGIEHYYKQIDKTRQQKAMAEARSDIGGEPAMAIPSRNPQIVSRPNSMV